MSNHLVELKRPKKIYGLNQSLTGANWGQIEVLQHFLSFFLIKFIFNISWIHRIYFTCNPTASFFRHRVVEWSWIEFKMRPMLFKKSWNLFYSNVIERSVKLGCLTMKLVPRFLFLSLSFFSISFITAYPYDVENS